MTSQSIFTIQGHKKVKAKLAKLLRKRQETIRQMESARSLGDLAENSAYHHYKSQVVLIDNQIDKLKAKLSDCRVVKREKNGNGQTVIGSRIKLVQNGQERILEITGDGEADPQKGMISASSPLAKSLLGKRVGDKVEVETPGGKKIIEIRAID